MKIAITHPRSGSHLLAHILNLAPLSGYYDDESAEPKPLSWIKNGLNGLDSIWFHYPYNEPLLNYLKKSDAELYVLLRDPRDIIVSVAHFVNACPNNFLNYLYTENRLADYPFKQRIDRLIVGMKNHLYDYDKWRQSGHFRCMYFRDIIKSPVAKANTQEMRRGITGSHKDEMTPKQIRKSTDLYHPLIKAWGEGL